MAFDYNTLTQASNIFSNLNNFQKHEILTVNSLQQVRDFNMNKGDSYLLLDPNSDRLYIKEVSTIGKVSIKVYSLTDVTDDVINNTTPVSITKSDFDKLLKRLEQLEGKNETAELKQSELRQPELNFTDK